LPGSEGEVAVLASRRISGEVVSSMVNFDDAVECGELE